MKKASKDSFAMRCKTAGSTCAAMHLRRASRALNQMYAAILKPTGLQPTQFTLLIACALSGPTPLSALAEALVMDRTTLARNLKPLEKQRLVRIDSGQDRRVRLVMLTEAGRMALAAALPHWEQAQKRVTELFDRQRLDHLLKEVAQLTTRVQSN